MDGLDGRLRRLRVVAVVARRGGVADAVARSLTSEVGESGGGGQQRRR